MSFARIPRTRTRRRPRPRFDRARQDVIAGEKRISGNS
jgi:hypothetical protein